MEAVETTNGQSNGHVDYIGPKPEIPLGLRAIQHAELEALCDRVQATLELRQRLLDDLLSVSVALSEAEKMLCALTGRKSRG